VSRDLRRELVLVAHDLHAEGWVANHDGNATARLTRGRFLITPTAVSKRSIDESMLVVVDAQGRKVSGRMKPFSEVGLHLTVYAERPDVAAVVHAHPPTATGLAWAGVPLDQPLAPEPVVSIGPDVPTVPYAPPRAQAEAALRPFARTHNVVLLANHGVLSWGPDLETAYLRMELVEHMARCALVAHQVGGGKPIPNGDVEALVAKRRKAGLEPPGFQDHVVAKETGEPDLAAIVRDEVTRALKGE